MADLLYPKESYIVQGAFYRVYKTFRNTQKESICHNALIEDMIANGLAVEKNKRISVYYEKKLVGNYIPDVIANDIIMIEIKCKPFIHENDMKQFWYYLVGSKYKVGYLVNFGKPDGVEFIRRVYDTARNNFGDFA